MRHGNCKHCAFWLTSSAARCPNCGLLLLFQAWGFAWVAALAGAAGGVLCCVWWASLVQAGHHSAIETGLAFISAGGLGMMVGGHALRRIQFAFRSEQCLQHQVRGLTFRLHDSEESLVRLAALRDRLRQEGDTWDDVRDVLSSAQGAYLLQRDRIRLQLWDVDLLRSMNRIQAAAHGWSRLGEAATEARIEALLGEHRNLHALQESLRSMDQAPAVDLQARRGRLTPALELSERLRQALLAREVGRTLAAIRPLDEPADSQAADALQQELETGFEILSARAGLDELAAGFQALEREQLRLQADLEIAALTHSG